MIARKHRFTLHHELISHTPMEKRLTYQTDGKCTLNHVHIGERDNNVVTHHYEKLRNLRHHYYRTAYNHNKRRDGSATTEVQLEHDFLVKFAWSNDWSSNLSRHNMQRCHPVRALAHADTKVRPGFLSTLLGSRRNNVHRKSGECISRNKDKYELHTINTL